MDLYEQEKNELEEREEREGIEQVIIKFLI
jgi:hypothetical protein